eukprot:TRINITY_DN12426_c0_g1_i2.p1 TRINITY_DN12426_c0_g1~~TRINITY_DN12426_c0_g1_i2.p1  ORF type:complete len:230 (+),score=21.04 TRINITY_DN12426_c0_g1_i2:160-849(+)
MEACTCSPSLMVFGSRGKLGWGSQSRHDNHRGGKTTVNFFSDGPLRFKGLSSSLQRPCSRISKNDIAGRASLMQKDERNVVENDNENHQTGTLEYWAIKFEQSLNILLTEVIVKILDILYCERDYARFFVLETIARVPYFAFVSVLHMYESFGWWRRSEYLKVHFAESWNELHHLLIMEALGGNERWFDRFLAQHIAIFYYFMTVFMYIIIFLSVWRITHTQHMTNLSS